MGDKNDRIKKNEVDMSYSVFLEQTTDEEKSLKYTLPKRVNNWVDDNTVISCYNCTKTFSLFVRKHHCRFCGKIFCAECSNFQAIIPEQLLSDDSRKGSLKEYVSSYIISKDPTKHKVCKTCKDIVDFLDQVRILIEIFLKITLDIKILKKMGQVCKEWHGASHYILTIFKEIQDKLPNKGYTKLEKALLWNNIEYISGHNKYMVHLVKSCDTPEENRLAIESLKKKKVVKCWSMMCGRNCYNKLTSFDSINLLSHSFKQIGHNDILRKSILGHLTCSDKELKCYFPLLLYYVKYDNGNIADFLVEKCINNFSLLNALYWELQLYPRNGFHEDAYSNITDKLKELFKNKKYEANFIKLLEGNSLVKALETISKAISEENKSYEDIKDKFSLKGILTSPLNNKSQIKSIHIEKIKVKDSATKPIIIPCETHDGNMINILYKREDMRKDQMIMNLIQLVDVILKKEENLDLGLITYNILPTGKNTGMLEIVENSETMYYIQEKLKSNIWDYISEVNGDCKINDVKDAFTKSVAGYSVITYLFGIGDRHLDNIMISRSGKLFHIDYGYILGTDPVVNNPGIRITPEIIEVLGGLSSKRYETFTNLCSRIYNCLRRHIDIFLNMTTILPKMTDMKITDNDIYNLLMKRFIPGENQKDAKLHFINQMEKQTYIDKIKDWCHYHSREQTVSSAMNRLSFAMSNLITQKIMNDKSQDNEKDNQKNNNKK